MSTKRPGPPTRIGPQVPFNTSLPLEYRQRLEAYATSHGVSLAEALRRAIDALHNEDVMQEMDRALAQRERK
jgi:hypothetical protein